LSIERSMKAEDRRVDLHILQAGAKLVERGFHLAGQFQRVAGRLLLDDQHDAGAVVDDRIPDRRGRGLDHPGDVADPDRRLAALADDRLGQVRGGLRHAGLRNGEPLVGRVDEAAAAHQHRIAGSGAQLGQGDAGGAQPVGVDQDLELAVALAPHRDIGDAGDSHQMRADRPAHQFGKLHLVELGGRYADLHRPAGRGERRHHHRLARGGGQAWLDLRHPLADDLARAHDIAAALEQDLDRRQAEHRF
jgi:hypothetical protein